MNDFFLRRKIFLIIIIILLLILPIMYIVFTTFSQGLDINANLDLQNNALLTLQIKNTSSHTINFLQIYLNDKLMLDLNVFDINSNLDLEYPLTREKNILIVKADNYLDYEKSFSVNKNALQKDVLTYAPEYLFRDINEISDINMTICAKEDLDVNLEINVEELEYNKVDSLNLVSGQCITTNYQLNFTQTGVKKVKFKISNDVYFKELLISGNVN